MALTLSRIEALAPDQSSVDAARKLLKAGLWPKLAWDGGDLVWGECQGSGSTPYRVVIAESDAGYKCSCPSRKFPCKHSLALMWMRAEGKAAFQKNEVPQWVTEWTARRRGPGAAVASDAPRSVSLTAVAAEEAAPDEKALARAAAAQERNRRDREASVLAGLEELDLWLADQVDRGMAVFVARSAPACRLIAQRLVDAKAPGLATRVDAVPAQLFSLPEPRRAEAAVEELGQLHLLAEAYRRQELLSPGLRADVRQAIGWTVTREALLADESVLRARAVWRVVGTLSEVQPDKLRRIETWLLREGGVGEDAAPRFAVLIDFVPVATGAAGSGYTTGDRLEAELAFYPSAAPLRALVAQSFGGAQTSAAELEPGEDGLAQAYAGYQAALARLPWLHVWPLKFGAVRVRSSGNALYVCDGRDGGMALPLRPAQADMALPLVALERMDGVGIWDGRFLTLCWAQTALGRWVAG